MSFDNGIQFEVNGSTGSDTANGGGFSPACTGFATDLAATVATSGAPIVTSASYNFITRDNGAYLFLATTAGNFSPGWYLIASTAGNAATLTATVGSAVLYGGATPTNIVAGCATVASPTGGHWGIDYSRAASPAISYTDLVIDGTTNTKVTSAGNPIGPNVIGNVAVVTSGTGFTTQYVQFVSVSGTTGTVDKSLGTLSSTGGHAGLGGALASPGKAGGLITGSGIIFVVGSNTYTMSASANVAGGCLSSLPGCSVVGYTASRYPYNLDATRPVFQPSANSVTMFFVGNPSSSCHCIVFQANGKTGAQGFMDSNGWGNSDVWNCVFNGISIGVNCRQNSIVEYCWFENCTGTTALQTQGGTNTVKNCVFTGCTTVTFTATFVSGCVFYNNGSSSSGVVAGASSLERCLFHTVTVLGSVAAELCYSISDCIFWNISATSAAAVTGITTNNTAKVINCAFGSNTSDVTTSINYPGYRVIGKIVLTGDPCTNASGGDFSLNNTAGAGALLRGAGFPATFANGLTANHIDVGPVQHQDSPATVSYVLNQQITRNYFDDSQEQY